MVQHRKDGKQNNRQELAGCVWPRIDKSFELDFFSTYDFRSAYYTGAVAHNLFLNHIEAISFIFLLVEKKNF